MKIKTDEDRFFEAVRRGVDDAVWRMITNATSMPCTDFYDSVMKGVEEGIRRAAREGAFDVDKSS